MGPRAMAHTSEFSVVMCFMGQLIKLVVHFIESVEYNTICYVVMSNMVFLCLLNLCYVCNQSGCHGFYDRGSRHIMLEL